jgi:hypothetical protein
VAIVCCHFIFLPIKNSIGNYSPTKAKIDNHSALYFVVYMSSLPQYEVFKASERYKSDPEKLDLHNRFTRMLTTTLERHIDEIIIVFAPESLKQGEVDPELIQNTEVDKVFAMVERIVSYSSITVQLDAVRLLLASMDTTQQEQKHLFLKHFLQLLEAKQLDLDNQETAA